MIEVHSRHAFSVESGKDHLLRCIILVLGLLKARTLALRIAGAREVRLNEH